jgi:lipopolysaccharide cholinephosphotransferase
VEVVKFGPQINCGTANSSGIDLGCTPQVADADPQSLPLFQADEPIPSVSERPRQFGRAKLRNRATFRRRAPPATGDFRLLQLGNVALLKHFSAMCAEHGLQFWIDAGTMLGAVRHGGFIPWDDDIDVAMPLESYDRLCAMVSDPSSEFSKAIAADGFAVKLWAIVQIYSEKMKLQVDVFPWDFHCKKSMDPKDVEDFRTRMQKENQKNPHRNITPSERKTIHDRLRNGLPPDPGGMLFMGAGFRQNPQPIVAHGDIFPLKTLAFDGLRVPAPNNPFPILSTYYGNWKKFPPRRNRIPSHFGRNGAYGDEETREEVRKFIGKYA